MSGLVIRCGFDKWALCDGKTENGEFGLGTVVNWYDTFEEAVAMREKISECYASNRRFEVGNKNQAWIEANKIFSTDYEKDELSSIRAGYDVYRHRSLNYNNCICDLGNRLEVNIDGKSINIWIKEGSERIGT